MVTETMCKLILILEAPSLTNLIISYTRRPVIETKAFQATCTLIPVKNETINYRWIKDGVQTLSQTGVLSLPSVSRTDAGSYRCRVSNIAGHVDSQPFTLIVHCMCLSIDTFGNVELLFAITITFHPSAFRVLLQ